jgi:hypothetical protein
MYYDENDYLNALAQYHYLKRKTWLVQYFELYKSTLIWPDGLPPIKTCNLIEGTIKEKFYTFYRAALEQFDYEFDNDKRSLVFL